MRINARLDEASEQELNYLAKVTGQSVSQVVREAVSRYCREVRTERVGLRHFAQAVGLGDSGHANIAGNVKKHYAEALQAKYPLHFGRPIDPASE